MRCDMCAWVTALNAIQNEKPKYSCHQIIVKHMLMVFYNLSALSSSFKAVVLKVECTRPSELARRPIYGDRGISNIVGLPLVPIYGEP